MLSTDFVVHEDVDIVGDSPLRLIAVAVLALKLRGIDDVVSMIK